MQPPSDQGQAGSDPHDFPGIAREELKRIAERDLPADLKAALRTWAADLAYQRLPELDLLDARAAKIAVVEGLVAGGAAEMVDAALAEVRG